MSYDLFLSSESRPLSGDQFRSWFEQRPGYTVHGDEARYENEDTGVYFSFEYDTDNSTVAFNMNYYRPHFFGLEAVGEVEAFVEAFDLSPEDPQNDGMGDASFSKEGFLRGWNAGNQFAYRAILSSGDRSETQIYPTAELERIWNWNYHRISRQEEVGESLFVPKYMFMKGSPTAQVTVVWPDACPIYLPKADFVLVLRWQLSSRPEAEDPREFTVVQWSDIEPMIAAWPYDEQLGCHRLDYATPPEELTEFIQNRPLKPHDPQMGLANDSVLNAELVEEARAGM